MKFILALVSILSLYWSVGLARPFPQLGGLGGMGRMGSGNSSAGGALLGGGLGEGAQKLLTNVNVGLTNRGTNQALLGGGGLGYGLEQLVANLNSGLTGPPQFATGGLPDVPSPSRLPTK